MSNRNAADQQKSRPIFAPEVIDNQCWVRIPNGPEKVYAAKMASRNAYDMHRDVYDLHRKFCREMAAESSRKIDIDKNTPLIIELYICLI